MKKQEHDLKNHLSIKDINIEPWLLHLVQIHDSAFPTGTFAHSFGLETYIQAGKITESDELFDFCDSYLRYNLSSADGILVKEAYILARQKDLQGLLQLEQICHGMKLSAETRKGSGMLGRQFYRMVRKLKTSEIFSLWGEKISTNEISGHYPIVYGIYIASMGVDLATGLSLFLYSSATTIIQNAVRAVPFGQSVGIEVMYRLLPLIHELTAKLLSKTLADLNNSAIGLEISSMNHEYLYSRLFIS